MATTQGNDWLGAQQKYWDTWFEAQRNAFGGAQEQATPWAQFLKEWQNAVFKGQQTADADAFQHRFAKAGEEFLNMMQQFYQATGQAKPVDQMTKEWMENLQKFFSDAFHRNSQPFDISQGYQAFTDHFAKAGQAWTSAFQSGKNPFASFDPLGSFTTMPGLGYTREKQERLNELYNDWVEYQRKSRAYDAAMAKVGLEAVKKFQEYLANPGEGQPPLDSLKAVYAKWIDICEDIYGKFAMSDEYIKLYGDTVNALMAFKQQQDKLTDSVMEQLNLPTRREVDSLHERLHALRRENIQLKKDMAELKAALKPASAAKTTGKKGKKS